MLASYARQYYIPVLVAAAAIVVTAVLLRLRHFQQKVQQLLLSDLPADVLQHIVFRIPLAHHIARAAPTCRALSVAARNAFKARPFSGEVVTLVGHANVVTCVAAAPDGRETVKLFNVNDGTVLRTFKHHTNWVICLALLPDGRRFVSGSNDKDACIVEHGLAPQ